MKSDRRSLNSILIKTTHKIGTKRMPQKPKQKSLAVVKLDTVETNKQNGRRMQKEKKQDWNHKPNRILHTLRKVKWVKINDYTCSSSSKSLLRALSMDDAGPALVVLLLLDPHLLEGGERGQDGAPDPDAVLALRRGDDLDGHRVRGQRLDLLLDALRDVLVHRGPARHHDVAVQVLPDVHVALHDRRERQLVDALLLQAQELRLEQ